VPITVFYCQECETILLDEKIMEKVYAQFEKHGADIWFEKDISYSDIESLDEISGDRNHAILIWESKNTGCSDNAANILL
jgi:isoleucyl-tRNA synthetase